MNQYQLTDEVGKTSYSTIYKGRKRNTIEFFTITSFEKCRRAFILNSTQHLRTFSHPNIIQFYGWYETGHHLWVITEYCTGGDLHTILKESARMRAVSVQAYASDLVAGLVYLHSRGVLCNNLASHNILLDSTASLCFHDFSLACSFAAAAEQHSVGSPRYMAPELFLVPKGTVSTASDIWSLGCVLYELASGAPPFTAASLPELMMCILTQPVPPIADAGAVLNELLQHMLAKNPTQRATWADVLRSSYWQGSTLALSIPSLPPQPALERYKSLHAAKTHTERELRAIVERCVRAAQLNWESLSRASQDSSVMTDTMDAASELDFTPAGPLDLATLPPSPPSLSTPGQALVARSMTVDRHRNEAKADEATEMSVREHGSAAASVTPSTLAAKNNNNSNNNRRATLGYGEAAQGGALVATQPTLSLPPAPSSQSGRRSASREAAQIADVTAAMTSGQDGTTPTQQQAASLGELLWHASDAHTQPLCMNNRIERYVRASFDPTALGFDAHTVEEVKAMTGEQLTSYVKLIYRRLAAPAGTTSAKDKLQILYFLSTICTSTATASVLVNSSLMTLCLKLAGQLESGEEFRVAAATVMGLLVRHTTYIYADLAHSDIIAAIGRLYLAEPQVRVRRRLLACLGELLYYIAMKPAAERGVWAIEQNSIRAIYLDALTSSDEALQHYAAKTIENVASAPDKAMAVLLFCSEPVAQALLSVYELQTALQHNEYLRASALCAAAKLTIVNAALTRLLFHSPSLPKSGFAGLLDVNPTPRTAQIFLTFLCFATYRALLATGVPRGSETLLDPHGTAGTTPDRTNTHSSGAATTAGPGALRDSSSGNSARVKDSHYDTISVTLLSSSPATLTVTVAREILSDMGELCEELLDRLCDNTLDSAARAMRGKMMLFLVLLGHLGETTFARLCTSRRVGLLERLMRDRGGGGGDEYVPRCATLLARYLTLFIADKLSCVAQRVSPSTTALYLAALQRLMKVNVIRCSVDFGEEVFRSLAECLTKSLSNTLYRAYEDDFNAIVNCIVCSPEIVVRCQKPLCTYLVQPYTNRLQQKESPHRFLAVRFLTTLVSALSEDKTLAAAVAAADGDDDDDVGSLATAIDRIVTATAAVLPALLAELNPLPLHTVRLLTLCAECRPNALATVALTRFCTTILDRLYGRQAIEPSYPLALICIALRSCHDAVQRRELARVITQQKFALLVNTLTTAREQGDEATLEACCQLIALVLQTLRDGGGAVSEASLARDLTQVRNCCANCTAHRGMACVRGLLLPLCVCDNAVVAQAAATVIENLVHLVPNSQRDVLSSDGAEALCKVLQSGPTDGAAVARLLLAAMNYALLQRTTSSDLWCTASLCRALHATVDNAAWPDAVVKEAKQLIAAIPPKMVQEHDGTS